MDGEIEPIGKFYRRLGDPLPTFDMTAGIGREHQVHQYPDLERTLWQRRRGNLPGNAPRRLQTAVDDRAVHFFFPAPSVSRTTGHALDNYMHR